MASNANKKFEEAAEYRKGWAPYEELGINQLEPDTLAELFAFQDFKDPLPGTVNDQLDQALLRRALASAVTFWSVTVCAACAVPL